VHLPSVEHASDFAMSHATQAFPPRPQVAGTDELHALPEQHPAGQFAAQPEQTPAAQLCPPAHSVQCCPAAPHAVVALPVWHAPVLSQHPAQEVASHTHAPDLQRCPELHAGPVPHWQAPDESHPSLDFVSQDAHEQRPSLHVSPGVHIVVPQVGPGWA
jgi:hypothetical protein